MCYAGGDQIDNPPSIEDPISLDELNREMNTMISNESVNIATCLKNMRLKPISKSKFDIPLCRMISLQAVRPYLKNDVMSLASHFLTNGYLESNGNFFVALENHEGKVVIVTNDVTDTWSPHWVTANTAFENLAPPR